MADTDGFRIRVPVLLRAWVVVFLVFWCSTVVFQTVVHGHGYSYVVGALAVLFAAVMGYRLFGMGVTARPDGILEVRNIFGTRLLQRDQIEDARTSVAQTLGPISSSGIALLMHDGLVINLDVARGAPWRAMNVQRRDVERLRSWLGGGGAGQVSS